MDAAGFARSGFPAQYSPAVAYALVANDVSNSSTSFVNLLTTTIATESPLDLLNILATASCDIVSSGGTPFFQITVDGVDVGQFASTEGNANGSVADSRIATISGLSLGRHTVALNWKSNNGATNRILASSAPSNYHGALVVRRNRLAVTSDMGGFPGLIGWPVHLSCGAFASSLAGSATSTSTTITDTLLSTTVTTRLPSSALMIRFATTGANNSQVTAKFQVLVDGIAACGTADFGDGATFAFNAGLVCVVPVHAGNHSVVVNWGGGSGSGSTINPGAVAQFATLLVEEMFCTDPDVGNLPISDMGGLPVAAYDSRNLPRIYFSKLSANNVGVSNSVVAQCAVKVPEATLFIIEGTLTISNGASSSVSACLSIDGTSIAGCKRGQLTNVGTSSLYCTHVVSLLPGMHTVQLIAIGGGSISPLTNAFEHASLLVREAAN